MSSKKNLWTKFAIIEKNGGRTKRPFKESWMHCMQSRVLKQDTFIQLL